MARGRARREPAPVRQTVRITLAGASNRLVEQTQLHRGYHRLGFVRDPELEQQVCDVIGHRPHSNAKFRCRLQGRFSGCCQSQHVAFALGEFDLPVRRIGMSGYAIQAFDRRV